MERAARLGGACGAQVSGILRAEESTISGAMHRERAAAAPCSGEEWRKGAAVLRCAGEWTSRPGVHGFFIVKRRAAPCAMRELGESIPHAPPIDTKPREKKKSVREPRQ